MEINKSTIKSLVSSIKTNANFVDKFVWDDKSWIDLGNGALLVKKVLARQTVTDLFIHGNNVGTVSYVRDADDLEDRLDELFTLMVRHVAFQHGTNIIDECREANWDFNKYGFVISKKPLGDGLLDIWTIYFNGELIAQLVYHKDDRENAEFTVGQSIRSTVLSKCFGEGFTFEILPGELLIRNQLN